MVLKIENLDMGNKEATIVSCSQDLPLLYLMEGLLLWVSSKADIILLPQSFLVLY